MAFPYIKSSLVEVTSILKSNYRVFFKNELEQPSGSFKLKGIGFLVGKSIDQAKTLKKTGVEVFSSSGGNAGLAAAHSAKYYQVPCTVVLPKTSKLIVIKKLEELNAKVIVEGNHWGEADEYLRKSVIGGLPESIYPVYVHPFDNPVIWEGHGIFIDELKDQMSPLELSKIRAVVCSVGGEDSTMELLEDSKETQMSSPTHRWSSL